MQEIYPLDCVGTEKDERRVMVERYSPEIPQWSGSHSKSRPGTGKSTNDRKSRTLFWGIGKSG